MSDLKKQKRIFSYLLRLSFGSKRLDKQMYFSSVLKGQQQRPVHSQWWPLPACCWARGIPVGLTGGGTGPLKGLISLLVGTYRASAKNKETLQIRLIISLSFCTEALWNWLHLRSNTRSNKHVIGVFLDINWYNKMKRLFKHVI